MKNIVFLFSGQSRLFPFAHNPSINSINILNSYNNFIFTPEFKSNYKYKIYITTDDIHLHNTISYFNNENIGVIHLLNTNCYINDINIKSKNIQIYYDKYNDNIDWSRKYEKYDSSIEQHYKIMDCYNLFINDSNNDINIKNCDFIVRSRLDTEFRENIIDIIRNFDINPKLEIVVCWDLFAIGKPKIMEYYCNGLNNNYGKYDCHDDVQNYFIDRNELLRWKYAPETQLFEQLYEFCNKNNLIMTEVIKQIGGVHIIRA